jgi:hypothetical protein
MYLRRVSDADAARYRRDPEAVMAATMGASFGGAAFPADMEGLFDLDGALGRPRGFFGWIKAWLIKRALKAALSKQLAQLNKVKAAIAGPPDQAGPADIPSPDEMVDLHKSWQILHYVFTGTPDGGPAPLNLLLVGGEEVGEDMGYGPARLIDARAMQDFAHALKAFDVDKVLARLDVAGMASAGVYCVHEDDEEEGQLIELEEDLRQYLPALQAFAERAAAERQGALIWLS